MDAIKLSNSIAHLLRIDDTQDNIKDFVVESIAESLHIVEASTEDVVCELSQLFFNVSQDNNIQWRIICTGCYLLLKLSEYLESDTDALLSISQKLNVKKLLYFIVSNGIHPSLLPGVGISSQKIKFTYNLNDMEKYERLKAVVKFMNKIYWTEELRIIILSNYFSDYLAALHQLSYAPIVKPNSTITLDNQPFIITKDMWENLQIDQRYFKNILSTLITKTHQSVVIKELIVLQGVTTHPLPNFMKRALSKELSECLTAPGGLHAVMQCFLDSSHIDTGSQWKHIDMVTRLVSVKHGSMSDDEYLSNICSQLSHIMQTFPYDNYIIVAAACITSLYEKFKGNKHIESLIDVIISPFKNRITHVPENTILLTTSNIQDEIYKLDLCFCHPKLSLPIVFLNPIIHCLFLLRVCLGKTSMLSPKIDSLISKYLSSDSCNKNSWFNLIILGEECQILHTNKTIEFEIINGSVMGKASNCFPSVNVGLCIDTLIEIIESSTVEGILAYNFFSYLLNVLSDLNNSMKTNLSKDLEDHNDAVRKSENLLCVTRGLEVLAGKECVLKCFKNDPKIIVDFIKKFLLQHSANIQDNSSNYDECLTISLVLLSTLLTDTAFDKKDLLVVVEPLKIIVKHSPDEGIKYLCKEVLDSLSRDSFKETKIESKFDKAINEICDPLLPVRAHGLMELSKLIEVEDIETLSKKEFVQCIFQENLKDPDSYIYLAAIKGLSTLGKYCTEDVLEILSKEYLTETKNLVFTAESEDENLKLRMKVGEILLKITRNLGDEAAKHKVVLLNTFLSGCHDNDNFMRASSLSNLAELCRVLSYKLGDIIFDILKCVDNIIQYDKSIECRRASVLVISSLIRGLGEESLMFLRDALLPMYRTLKKLYSDEKEDSVVRLHAQIALEELNDIMREIMAPYLKHKDDSD